MPVNSVFRANFWRLASMATAVCATISPLSSRAAPGSADVALLHAFGFPPPDGAYPNGALIADSAGRLYGVTLAGGAFRDPSGFGDGYGTIFRLTRPVSGAGRWTEEILHSFSGSDGKFPNGNLVLDSAGVIYGTTSEGGHDDHGTVFRLDPTTGTLTRLHVFQAQSGDGLVPAAGLSFGPGGLLYGTTSSGGASGSGIMFSISPLGDATEYAVLHDFQRFDPHDGAKPLSNLVTNGSNHLFGTTSSGGAYSRGTVFEFTLDAHSQWVEDVIYNFAQSGSDVGQPNTQGDLILGLHDELYGCAPSGGTANRGGVFSLTPPMAGGAVWTETVIANIAGGLHPYGNCAVTMEPSGNLLETLMLGGQYEGGSVSELTPPVGATSGWSAADVFDFSYKGFAGETIYGALPNGPLLRVGKTYFGVNGESSAYEHFGHGHRSGSGTVYGFRLP